MKYLLCLLIACSSICSFAQSMGSWKELSSSYERANTAQEFILLQKKYPETFSKYDPSSVKSAEITITKYQYEGETTCMANDPRLTHLSKSYDICFETGSNSASCMQGAESIPAPFDPCSP